MAPKHNPYGRGEDAPQWTTAAAARLDTVLYGFERQWGVDYGDTSAVEPTATAAGVPDAAMDSPPRPSAAGSAGASSSAAAPSRRGPTADADTRSPAMFMSEQTMAHWAEGVAPRSLPSDPATQLAGLRLATTRPQSFAPWRHTVMVCGRPVVVLIELLPNAVW